MLLGLAPLLQGHSGEGVELALAFGPSRAADSLSLVPVEIYCLELEAGGHSTHRI